MNNLVRKKLNFVENYINSFNAADGSAVDANANVVNKNIASMMSELPKEDFINTNRAIMYKYIKNEFSTNCAEEYLKNLNDHIIYKHDETSLAPYCCSISMYPFLINGLKGLGGESHAPKHLDSYCGSFINLIFAVASQFAGAVATVEWLMYFDHFARKDFGEDYLSDKNTRKFLESKFQQVVYSLNQPAGSRGYQSPFWNITIMDEFFFNHVFSDFMFPDGDKPVWKSLNRLQKVFLKWFQKERTIALLSYPVISMGLSTSEVDGVNVNISKEWTDFTAGRMLNGDDFFNYQGPPTAIASCCRLKNDIDVKPFSHTLGAGGIQTGSISVMSLNLPRFAQMVRKNGLDLISELKKKIKYIQKWQIGYKRHIEFLEEKGMLPVYDEGFMELDNQYLTVGLVGLPEAYESFTGKRYGNNDHYKQWCREILHTISVLNIEAEKEYGIKFNTEMVPAENLAVKFARWDREDGYDSREIYSSYFYIPEDENVNISDKFILHGELNEYLDGGQALHLNLKEPYMTWEQARYHLDLAAKLKLNYWCWNVPRSVCQNPECGYIAKRTHDKCPKCGSDVYHATRIIGYLKKIDNFSKDRRKEAEKRIYHSE